MKAQLRPVPSYFWWLREVQAQAGVTSVRRANNNDASTFVVASTARSTAA